MLFSTIWEDMEGPETMLVAYESFRQKKILLLRNFLTFFCIFFDRIYHHFFLACTIGHIIFSQNTFFE